MVTPTVSVVVPSHNAAPFLREALASVARQTLAPLEVIVVDDASTDDSRAIAEGCEGVRVIACEQNVGAAGARNAGVAVARGELVAFLDADDIWHPTHLATVVSLLESHPECGLGFSLVKSFGLRDNVWEAALPENVPVDAFWASWRRGVVPANSVVVRREVLTSAGGFDETLRAVEDFECWLRLSRRTPFVCTHTVTAAYRKHSTQRSRALEFCRRVEYAVRDKVLENARRAESPEFVRRLEREYLACWEERCLEAWSGRDSRLMSLYLELGQRVPGAAGARRRWSRRARLLPMVRRLDRLSPGLRASIKRFPIVRALIP